MYDLFLMQQKIKYNKVFFSIKRILEIGGYLVSLKTFCTNTLLYYSIIKYKKMLDIKVWY